jgi:lipopolysaccharide biosynthesis glycosyltransferase
MSYNGWKNYETWNVSLWYGDVFADMASEQKLRSNYLEFFVVEMEMEKISQSSLGADIMNAFLRRVDWDELADRYNADSGFEDEAEEEMEDA